MTAVHHPRLSIIVVIYGLPKSEISYILNQYWHERDRVIAKYDYPSIHVKYEELKLDHMSVAEKLADFCHATITLEKSLALARFVEKKQFGVEKYRQLRKDKNKVDGLLPVTVGFPRKLNIGCRFNWQRDCINIDSDPNSRADIFVEDDNFCFQPVDQFYHCHRLGRLQLKANYFENISVQEKLSHVKDLVAFMSSCLKLLQPGGVLELTGAYDLSVEAWQDPRSVRSFNERSFIYFTDWFWQLGWDEYRFEQENINFQLSPHGVKLQHDGQSDEEIISQPRTVSSITVRLRKIALTDADKETLRKSLPGTNP